MSEPTKAANCELGYFANYVNRGVTISAVRYDELKCSRVEFEKDFVSFLAKGHDGVLHSRSHQKVALGFSDWQLDTVVIGTEPNPEVPQTV